MRRFQRSEITLKIIALCALVLQFPYASPKLVGSQSLLVAQSVTHGSTNGRNTTKEEAFALLSDDQKLLECFKF